MAAKSPAMRCRRASPGRQIENDIPSDRRVTLYIRARSFDQIFGYFRHGYAAGSVAGAPSGGWLPIIHSAAMQYLDICITFPPDISGAHAKRHNNYSMAIP